MRIIKCFLILLHILVGLVLLVVTGALWNPHRLIVKRVKRWWLNRTVRLVGVDVEIYGNQPRKTRAEGFIYVSNHVSWLDIPLIGGIQETGFLSKVEVKDWPLIGKLAQGTGTLFIKRGSGDTKKITQQIADRVNDGHSILFFPEGTTTDGRTVKSFHRRLFRVSENTNALFCPVVINYEVDGEPFNPVAFIDDDEFADHLWHLLSFDHIKAKVEFLPPRTIEAENLQQQVLDLEKLMRRRVEARNTHINLPNNQSLGKPVRA